MSETEQMYPFWSRVRMFFGISPYWCRVNYCYGFSVSSTGYFHPDRNNKEDKRRRDKALIKWGKRNKYPIAHMLSDAFPYKEAIRRFDAQERGW